VLFDHWATYSFVASETVEKLGNTSRRLEKKSTISIFLWENIDIDMVYMGIKLDIMGWEISVDLKTNEEFKSKSTRQVLVLLKIMNFGL
jgi:hypothetical protein